MPGPENSGGPAGQVVEQRCFGQGESIGINEMGGMHIDKPFRFVGIFRAAGFKQGQMLFHGTAEILVHDCEEVGPKRHKRADCPLVG